MSKPLLLILPLFLLTLLPLNIANAQLDQRCFTEEQCTTARSKLPTYSEANISSQLGNGFYRGTDAINACNDGQIIGSSGEPEPAGFCLPVGQAQTQIKIAGEGSFANIADFIQYIYKYSFIVAAVLATIMVILSGIQWIVSGGDSSKIQSAKKRIGGSIIGVLILATSYVILQTINPALVNLRLPRTFMIQEMSIMSPSCSDITNSAVRIALARDNTIPNATIGTVPDQNEFTLNANQGECGKDYFMSSGGSQLCMGTFCPLSSPTAVYTCGQKTGDSVASCLQVNIVGNIASSEFIEREDGIVLSVGRFLLGEGWYWPWLDDGELLLYRICTNNNGGIDREQVSVSVPSLENNEENKSQFFQISVDNLSETCGDQDFPTLKGYVLALDINEIELEQAVASITGDFLATVASPLLDLLSAPEEHYIGNLHGQGIDISNTGANISDEQIHCYLSKTPTAHFIQPDELRNGVQIDIDVAQVADIDDESDRIIAYGDVGDGDESSAGANDYCEPDLPN
jgi:hypothetical protein